MRAFGAPSRSSRKNAGRLPPRQIGEHRRGAIGVQAALLAAVAAFAVPFDRDVPELAAALVLPLVELPPEQDRAAHRVAQREVERVGRALHVPDLRETGRVGVVAEDAGEGDRPGELRAAQVLHPQHPGIEHQAAVGRKGPRHGDAHAQHPFGGRRGLLDQVPHHAGERVGVFAAHRKGAFLPAFGEDAALQVDQHAADVVRGQVQPHGGPRVLHAGERDRLASSRWNRGCRPPPPGRGPAGTARSASRSACSAPAGGRAPAVRCADSGKSSGRCGCG